MIDEHETQSSDSLHLSLCIKKLISYICIYNCNRTEWSPIRSVIIRVIPKISPICLITSMTTDQIGRHKVLLPINCNQYNYRENKCSPFSAKELLIASTERNTSQIHPFWKIPSLVGSVVVAMVIVINYVIGGLS